MADENQVVAAPPADAKAGAIVVPTQVTTEVLDNTGSTANTNRNLDSIFSKIESGKSAQDAIRETMDKPEASEASEQAEPEEKPEVKPPEQSALADKLAEVEENKREDSSRAALAKEADKPNRKEDKPAPEDKPEDSIPDDELQVLPHDKPKTAKRISALLNKIKSADSIVAETKKDADAKAARLKELEAQLSTVKTVDPKTEEAVKKQLDELAMFRRRYDLEKDPEVKSRFDDRINATDTSIAEVLKRKGASDAFLKIISDEGGWTKFVESDRMINLGGDNVLPASEVAEKILSELPITDRKAVEASMMEKIQLSREKTRYFEEQQRTAQDYFKKQEDERIATATANQKQVQESTKLIEDWQRQQLADNEFLKEKPVPPDAAPEVKAAIEEDNAYTGQLKSLLKQSVNVKDIKGALEMVLDSVKYYDERRKTAKLSGEVERLKGELKAKEAEISKIKTASRSTPRSGSIAGGTAGGSEASKAPKKVQGLEAAFEVLSRGGKLNQDGFVSDSDE